MVGHVVVIWEGHMDRHEVGQVVRYELGHVVGHVADHVVEHVVEDVEGHVKGHVYGHMIKIVKKLVEGRALSNGHVDIWLQ